MSDTRLRCPAFPALLTREQPSDLSDILATQLKVTKSILFYLTTLAPSNSSENTAITLLPHTLPGFPRLLEQKVNLRACFGPAPLPHLLKLDPASPLPESSPSVGSLLIITPVSVLIS